jgi:glycogen(starch) synthase
MHAESADAADTFGPRRVLMTADTLGGVWVYALELIEALAAYGIEVSLVTMGTRLSPDQRAQIARLDNVQLFETAYKLEWMDDPWSDVEASGRYLLELESQTSPDIVHINGYAHAALPFDAPVLAVGHSCVYSWYAAVYGRRPPDPRLRYYLSVRRGLGSADAVTAPTQTILSALGAIYGPFAAADPIPNGRTLRYPARPKEPLIFSAGRLWDAAKNIAVLEQAAGSVRWPIYAAGQRQHPNGQVMELKNVQTLELLTAEQVASWMAAASIFVLPSRYEPFGLSALEAAICECALVLGDIPSLREVWGPAALYAQPDDAAAVIRQIQRLIDSPALLKLYAERAVQRARCFSAGRMAVGYVRLYTELMKEARREQAAFERYAAAQSPV